MPSHNLARVQLDDLDLLGYSIAGEETVVGIPQLDVCFDIGKAPDQLISINHVLLTHGHMDHAAGFAYYLSQRNFNGMAPGTIAAPANLIPAMREILAAWGHLDGSRVPGNLVGVRPGEEVQIKPNLLARVFPVKHSPGAVGYCVLEKRKKLKPEYLELTGPQIVELKKQGIEIDYPLEFPLVSYLGDTQYVDFCQLDYVMNSRILIAECTFYEVDHAGRAEAGRHMHVKELAHLLSCMHNEHIIITHTTQRTPMQEVRRVLEEALPPEVWAKTTILMDRKRRTRP